MKSDNCQMTNDKQPAAPEQYSCHKPLATRHAFTLIELLVVIAIIGVLASLTVPVVGAIKRRAIVKRTRNEMAQIETAIDRYKAAYGFYPPDSATGPLTNQLYYELVGTTNTMQAPDNFYTLDGAHLTTAELRDDFGNTFNGFMNCAKSGSDESSVVRGQDFLPGLNSTQVAKNGSVNVLVASVGGPFDLYQPMSADFKMSDGGNANPWRYVSSHPQNNPNSYDLWVEIVFKPGQTNLICNWNDSLQVNSRWP